MPSIFYFKKMYITLLKVYCYSFLADAGCMFNWQMVDLLGEKGWIVHLDSNSFQVQSVKKKGKHAKYSVEEHSGKYKT